MAYEIVHLPDRSCEAVDHPSSGSSRSTTVCTEPFFLEDSPKIFMCGP